MQSSLLLAGSRLLQCYSVEISSDNRTKLQVTKTASSLQSTRQSLIANLCWELDAFGTFLGFWKAASGGHSVSDGHTDSASCLPRVSGVSPLLSRDSRLQVLWRWVIADESKLSNDFAVHVLSVSYNFQCTSVIPTHPIACTGFQWLLLTNNICYPA